MAKYKTPATEEMEKAWDAFSDGETAEVRAREFQNFLRSIEREEYNDALTSIHKRWSEGYYRYGAIAEWSKNTREGMPPESAEGNWKDWFDFGFRSALQEDIRVISAELRYS